MVKVRQASIEDVKALALLFDQYRVFYLQDSNVKAAEAFLRERFKNKESIILTAEDKHSNTPVGFTQLYPSFSSVSMKSLWILNDLFVEPGSRKKSVAKKLMQAAEDFAQKSGAIGLTLKTSRDNDAAKALYNSIGWKRDDQFVSYNIRFKNKKIKS